MQHHLTDQQNKYKLKLIASNFTNRATQKIVDIRRLEAVFSPFTVSGEMNLITDYDHRHQD